MIMLNQQSLIINCCMFIYPMKKEIFQKNLLTNKKMLQRQAVCGIIKSLNNYLIMGFKNIDLGNEKSWEKLGK